MMNHHLPAGPPAHIPPAVPMHSQSRRQQEYHHQYHHQPPPQSPVHHNPYMNYHHPQYFAHPAQLPYPPQRWPSHQPYPPYPMHAQPPYAPRSPLVVSSQPLAQPVMPITRQPSFPHVPQPSQPPPSAQSPRTAPPTPTASMPPAPVEPSSKSASPPKPATPPQPASRRSSAVTAQPAQPPQPTKRMPFYPELPWYSCDKAEFPARASRRRRRRQDLHISNDAVALPSRAGAEEPENVPEQEASDASTIAAPSEQETPATSQAPSEADATQVTTPTSAQTPVSASKPSSAGTHARRDTRTAVPIIPALPNIPAARPKSATSPQAEKTPATAADSSAASADAPSEAAPAGAQSLEEAAVASPPPKAAPKSWADLVRSKNAAAAASASASNGIVIPNNTPGSRAASLTDALKQYDVGNDEKIAFLEPRGLVNTGNMCYMNSILQVLVFCIPFYTFLDQVGKRAAHSFKSDTPLVDAMIMFMREFKIIDSAESADKLRMRLKDNELEEYGDSLIPEYVYDVIKRLPRFSTMRRGHQQDAEEFLGFLLEGLHDECVSVMKSQGSEPGQIASPTSITSPSSTNDASGWLEVGPKQRAAVTRQSGDSTSTSPITSIFGGTLRSEFRVPGLKNSVTLEPYQPLQLDIGAPDVNNIIDALKGLTRPETLTGDFNSPRGPGTTATKQVFIETLPPVLILHLKRFQYDSSGGTQKIWKKVGYPLELEIPKEVFPPAKRGGLAVNGGAPRYRLIAVVYHHGKSAAGGHYTVDLRRQDGKEWMRVDDTIIRRVRAEDVAEGGAEEDPKVLARALEQHQKADAEVPKRNLFEGLDGEEDAEGEGAKWKEVNGVPKKWAGGVGATANGSATPSSTGKRTPMRSSVKDNKVAYILLYEKLKG